ncbi:MAG: type II secretion system protein M [Gammaproteobacteria bacterium]|nr:type II secretion system protein M [Gammaproteobacteria bacterium]
MQFADLKNQLQGFAGRIDAMSIRERGLIFVTVLVALYFMTVNVLFGPISTEKDRLQKEVSQKQEETRALELQVQTLLASGEQNPEAAKRKKIEALQENLKTMDAALGRVTAGLVPPKEMARLVEQMLLKNRGLQLMKMESIPATPLLESAKEGAPATGMVYKHGMRIELKGNYLDILRYLKSLEDMEWKVFWGQVTLQTEKHPVSKVNLLIYTLSTHEAWIGL